MVATNSRSLLWRGCLSKVIKINVKPTVDVFMDDSVLGAELLGCHTFLESLHTHGYHTMSEFNDKHTKSMQVIQPRGL